MFNYSSAIYLTLLATAFTMCNKNKFVELPALPEFVEEKRHSFIPVVNQVNAAFGGFYIALPPDYFETSQTFPLLVFLHGAGQMGNGNTEIEYLTFDGIGKLIANKKLPSSFVVGGSRHSMIIVTPQSHRQPTSDEVLQFVQYIFSKYRVNKHRIYLSGLSMGARVVTFTGAKYPMYFAAIIPIAGVAATPGIEERCKRIAEASLPVWVFHNAEDPMADVADPVMFDNLINQFNPSIPPRLTIFNVYGHDAWSTALDPLFKEEGMNIYEWMLQFSR